MEQLTRHATEYPFSQAVVAVGADNQEVGAESASTIKQPFCDLPRLADVSLSIGVESEARPIRSILLL